MTKFTNVELFISCYAGVVLVLESLSCGKHMRALKLAGDKSTLNALNKKVHSTFKETFKAMGEEEITKHMAIVARQVTNQIRDELYKSAALWCLCVLWFLILLFNQ